MTGTVLTAFCWGFICGILSMAILGGLAYGVVVRRAKEMHRR